MKLRILKGQAGQKLAAENRKDFPGRMLGSHVENAGIKAPQARAGSSRSGGRGGARDLSRLVGTRVGLRPRLLSAPDASRPPASTRGVQATDVKVPGGTVKIVEN